MLAMLKTKMNMANKQCNNITMEMLQPNMESWSKYKNGIKPKEIVFIPAKGNDPLYKEIKSSEKSSILKKKEAKIPGMEDIGKGVEINNLNLYLKL
jgi:hypothetical protein